MKKHPARVSLQTESETSLWDHMKKGVEDAKAGRIKEWKPKTIRSH